MNRQDNFNRGGSVALGGATPSDGGSAWSPSGNSWATALDGGSGRTLAFDGNGGTSEAVLEASAADVDVTALVVRLDVKCSLLARYTDANNFLMFEFAPTFTKIWKNAAGSFTTLATGSGVTVGHTVKFTVSGSALSGYDGATLLASATETFNQTATKHGIRSGGAFTFLDDFAITDLGGGGATIHPQHYYPRLLGGIGGPF